MLGSGAPERALTADNALESSPVGEISWADALRSIRIVDFASIASGGNCLA